MLLISVPGHRLARSVRIDARRMQVPMAYYQVVPGLPDKILSLSLLSQFIVCARAVLYNSFGW